MTFGIDIATTQRDIDLVKAKAEGVEFVIVKMGGLNVAPLYVAPYYKAQIDKTIAVGLPKGHYYLIGAGQTPEAQAEYFVANLYKFDRDHDVLALDNEKLDGNGVRWGDAEAARFARRVIDLTGIPAERFWHYAGAADYRAQGQWPELVAVGVRFWWAAYGDYPTGHTPDHEPALRNSLPRWDVHQFSSKVAVAGMSVDGNYSNHSIEDLFGGIVPLKNYTLRAPSTVILADNRDPYVSWQNHLARTSGLRGGVDIVAPIGTPVIARTSGVLLHIPNDGTAGNSSRFHHDDNPGWKDVFSHLSGYVGVSGQHFNAGDVIAYTGNTGNVDPHLHWHLLDPNNVRRNPWDYFSGSSTAGGGTTPIGDDIMALKDAVDLFYTKDRGYIAVGPGFVYQIGDSDGLSGDQKLAALGAVDVKPRTVDTGTWDALRIIFLGNQAAVDNAKYAASLVKIPAATGGVDQVKLTADVVAGVLSGIPSGSQPFTKEELAKAVASELAARLTA